MRGDSICSTRPACPVAHYDGTGACPVSPEDRTGWLKRLFTITGNVVIKYISLIQTCIDADVPLVEPTIDCNRP